MSRPQKAVPVLQRSRRDWWATGAITAVCAVAVAGAFFTSNIRATSLEATNPPGKDATVEQLETIPTGFVEDARFNAPGVGNTRPVVAGGLVISVEGSTLVASYPDGAEAWRYTRDDAPLCSLGTAWGSVVATYRTGVGCGDVVSLNAKTGKYDSTRSAVSADDVSPVSSNDRVGTVAPERLELWRSDMVRTIEYGDIEAVQEPDTQPHEECTITSALTRTSLLALTETCPVEGDDTHGNDTQDWIRFMDTTPEDSREPEIDGERKIPAGSRLVSVGQEAAAVYAPEASGGTLIAINQESEETKRSKIPGAPALNDDPSGVFTPVTADLPHHMSWFDGERLHLFIPSSQAHARAIPDVIGTGVAVEDKLVVPTKDGLTVVNWFNAETERDIPLDRGDYTGPVTLSVAGDHIIEKRGDQLVSLRPD